MRPAYIWSISVFAHVALLLMAFAILSAPQLFATVPTEAIDVDLVPAEQAGADQQQQQGKTDPAQGLGTQAPSAQAPGSQAPGSPTAQPPDPATPTFASLYPWPVPAEPDKQAGDYRTFENASGETAAELGPFKARLTTCWTPPRAGSPKLSASLRVSLRPDGSLAGPPELVEAPASADGPALVQSAMQALRQCAPYGGLPADKYDSWKSLSLTFTPDGIKVAAVTR